MSTIQTPKLVSLITTARNRERFLGEALDSVLAQKYPHWELILWDDGSDDRTPEIAREYASRDDRIKLTIAPPMGRSAALAAAHDLARGEFVGWLDSDDRLDPAALAVTVGILANREEVGAVYTQYRVIDEESRVRGMGSRCRIPFSPQRLLVDFMTFHFRLMRQSAFRQAGGIDLSFPAAIDYDLCLRLSEVTQFASVQLPLYDYRVHDRSISIGSKQLQTQYSKQAVENALHRRQLADRYYLHVDANNQFIIRQRP
jgi:glycosyltransferase involved in cell wall biosynthesis